MRMARMAKVIGITSTICLLLVSMTVAGCGWFGGGEEEPQDAEQSTETSETSPTLSPAAESPTTISSPSLDTPTPTPEHTPLPLRDDFEGETLVVGTNVSPSYPPLEFVDESSGTVQGFDIDLARAIGERLNAAIRIETTYSFETLPAAIADGHVDLIISGIPIQREQTQGVVYSMPYLAIGQGVAVRRDLQIPITRVEDLSQLGLIGVQQNTIGEDALRNAGITSAQMYYVPGIDEAFVALARGTIDAVVADGAAVAWYTRQWEETIKLVGGPFAVNQFGIVMRPDDQRLRTAINGTLQDLKDDGTLQQLLNTWGLEHVAYIP